MLTIPSAMALGPLEYAIMRIIWAKDGPITVKQVQSALRHDRDLAYTTVMTTMVRLPEKGVLARAAARGCRARRAQTRLCLHGGGLAERSADRRGRADLWHAWRRRSRAAAHGGRRPAWQSGSLVDITRRGMTINGCFI